MIREWGVKWAALGNTYPEEVHWKPSQQAASDAIERSAFPGVVVTREVTEWQAAA